MTSNFNKALKCVSICALAALLLMFVGASRLQAQSASTGALTGVVTDPSGGSITGATVTATSLGTGQSRTTTTDVERCRTKFRNPAARKLQREDSPHLASSPPRLPSITINITETPVLNRSLEIGSQTQSVTVEATAETVQTQNATVGGLVAGQTVDRAAIEHAQLHAGY